MQLKRGERVDPNTLNFWNLLRTVKLKNVTYKYPATYLAAIISVSIYYFLFSKLSSDRLSKLLEYFSDTMASISATLLGIILAGLAIIVALAAGNILRLMLKGKILHKLLFPFWYVTVLWSISTALSIFIGISDLLLSNSHVELLLAIEVFIFTYSIYATVGLVGSSIKIMLILAQLVPEDK